MRALLLLLLLVATRASAQNTWRVVTDTDALTDKVKRSATVVNAGGNTLSVYRGPGDAAWVLFSLSPSSLDLLSPRRAPIYRIDKNEPKDLEPNRRLTEQGLGVDLYQWEPKWVNFRIWHGREDEGRGVDLQEMMAGRSIVFRYALPTGGYKETTFSLEGAGPVIAEALGISVSPTNDEEAGSAFRAALVAALKRCQQDMRTFSMCFDRVTACEKKAQRDLKTLQACLQ